MCDCPHRHILGADLAPAIRQMHLKRVSCSKCSDPDALIICLGCLKNFCSDHVHKCSPLVYFPAENVLFCKECGCEILSLDLCTPEQEQCFDVLRSKFKTLRNYNLRNFSGVDELMLRPTHFDKQEQVFVEEIINFVPFGQSADQIKAREAKKQQLADIERQIMEVQSEKETLIEELAQLQKEGYHEIMPGALPPKPEMKDFADPKFDVEEPHFETAEHADPPPDELPDQPQNEFEGDLLNEPPAEINEPPPDAPFNDDVPDFEDLHDELPPDDMPPPEDLADVPFEE